jgi:ubiquinone/menaquinone biosynthesis C-methylase UbiE
MTTTGTFAETTAHNAAHYDTITESWRELFGDHFHCRYYASEGGAAGWIEAAFEYVDRVASLAALRRGDRVLDVGCGIGGPALRLARRHGCVVTGISTSAENVSTARASAAGDATFDVGDGSDLPFASSSFDAVWMIETADLIPDKPRLFGELARVLRPGGRVVFANNVSLRRLTFGETVSRQGDIAAMGRVFGRLTNASPEAYGTWLAEAGFGEVAQHDLTTAIAPTLLEVGARVRACERGIEARLGAGFTTDLERAMHLWASLLETRAVAYVAFTAVKRIESAERRLARAVAGGQR